MSKLIKLYFLNMWSFYYVNKTIKNVCPDGRGPLSWVSSCKVKGHWCDFWSERLPGLSVHTSWSAYKRQPIDVSLLLFLPPFPSLKK